MAKCVEITLEDDGTMSVKECAPKEPGTEMDDGYEAMQVQDMEEAFTVASDILSQDSGTPMGEEQGFNSVFEQQDMGAQ